jgi:hypothetical protein
VAASGQCGAPLMALRLLTAVVTRRGGEGAGHRTLRGAVLCGTGRGKATARAARRNAAAAGGAASRVRAHACAHGAAWLGPERGHERWPARHGAQPRVARARASRCGQAEQARGRPALGRAAGKKGGKRGEERRKKEGRREKGRKGKERKKGKGKKRKEMGERKRERRKRGGARRRRSRR